VVAQCPGDVGDRLRGTAALDVRAVLVEPGFRWPGPGGLGRGADVHPGADPRVGRPRGSRYARAARAAAVARFPQGLAAAQALRFRRSRVFPAYAVPSWSRTFAMTTPDQAKLDRIVAEARRNS